MLRTVRAFACILTVSTALLLLPGSAVSAPQGQPTAPVAGEPYRVGGGVSRPEKISGSPPVYTEEARKARVMGVVILEAIIDEEGNVTSAKVLKGLPMGLDQAALEALQTWKFKPSTFEGRPVAVYYTLTVSFQVDGSPLLGPLFGKFLQNNPDFAAYLRDKRYPEAAGLLDRWAAERPADSGISLARSYLFLIQNRLDEAWEEARSYRGPEPHEVLLAIGNSALSSLAHDKTLDPERRAEVIEIGLEAMTMAMATRSDPPIAPYFKYRLLREKANLTSDPAARQALLDEANELEKLVTDMNTAAQEAKSKPRN